MRLRFEESGRRDRGAVLTLLALFLFIFMVIAALAVDLSALERRGQKLQNSADAAALAGVATWQETGDADLARLTVDDIIRQNGLGDDVTVAIDFPSSGELRVLVTDEDPDVFLGNFVVGYDPRVARAATAEFIACLAECSYEVEIPKPFSSVSAAGTGDGYKPISASNKLYALNHNSSNQHIVCVDRATQEPCWDGDVDRVAYSPAVGYTDSNPEMPLTGVVGTRIYWSASDSSGHRLFCWETSTDTPCPTAVQLSNSPRGDRFVDPIYDDKDENRGGGTVAVDGKIYDFTDNHEVHCYDPAIGTYCSGYGSLGGLPDGLAAFPDNEPSDGNHGSSIDRIVDPDNGWIYATLHINNAVGGVDCSSSLTDPRDERVVIRNASTGAYITVDGADPEQIFGGADGTLAAAQWNIVERDPDTVTIRSQLHGVYLDGGELTEPPGALDTSTSIGADEEWELALAAGAFTIRNDLNLGYITDIGTDIVESLASVPGQSQWQILPRQCGDPGYVSPPVPANYAAGTWLHCWDTGKLSGAAQPCAGFTPSRIHANADRFSGRLFFFHGAGDAMPRLGVCSTGYNRSLDPAHLEITCVDKATGALRPAQASALSVLLDQIAANTSSSPAAWGDPHWNDYENRLFYPTAHDRSRILCWDFDSGWCGSIEGLTPTGVVRTEDYGFFSEDNCVYALGHNAWFWAFQARDITQPCVGSTSSTLIERCPCGDTFLWGTLDFDVDLPEFDSFELQIIVPNTPEGEDPVVVYPTDGGWHDLFTDGITIDLDATGISTTEYTRLEVVVRIEAENDPFATGGQTLTIRFSQAPRLTE